MGKVNYHEHSDLVGEIASLKEHLARIEERVGMVQVTHDRFITREVTEVNKKIEHIEASLGDLFVTRGEFNAQFTPVKRFTELILGLILTALTLGILGTILNVSIN